MGDEILHKLLGQPNRVQFQGSILVPGSWVESGQEGSAYNGIMSASVIHLGLEYLHMANTVLCIVV